MTMRVMKTESSDNDKKTYGAVWKEQSIKEYIAAKACESKEVH